MLDEGPPGEVAEEFAAQAGAGNGEGRTEAEIGVGGGLRVAVVGEVIGAIGLEIGADRRGAKPLADAVVRLAVFEQQPVRGIVHQDREAELTTAENRQRDRRGEQSQRP